MWTREKHEEHRLKMLVVGKANQAIKWGRMKRLPCSICGDKKSEAHHKDYTKPLDVIFLCRKHHKELHTTLKRIGRKIHYNEEEVLDTLYGK